MSEAALAPIETDAAPPVPIHYALPSRARWALRVSTALLFLAGYMALGTVQGYGSAPTLVALMVLAITPIAERLDAALPLYRVITRAITVLCFCLIPVAILTMNLLDAVVALVVYIQFYTMLHQKEEKNYYHLFLMSFFLLLAACNQSPEAGIGLVLAVFLLATIWAFFSLRVAFDTFSSQRQIQADIVRFGEEPTRVAYEHRDPFGLGIFGYLSAMAVLSLGITLAFFFFTPRIEAGLLGRSNAPITRTGVPEQVQLSSGTTIVEDLTPVLRAEFPEEPGGRVTLSPLYWRMTTLSRFNGTGWRREQLSATGEDMREGGRHDSWQGEAVSVARSPLEGARTLRQDIYMDDVPSQGVPALDLVQRVSVTGNPRGLRIGWSGANDFTVTVDSNALRQLHYVAVSEIEEPNPEALRAAAGDFGLSADDLSLLTEHTLRPETVALARQVTEGQDNFYDQVMALQTYLSGPNYVYSLTVPPLPPVDAVDAFINTTRTGHCELFATALALMTRSLGIPARVVSGFKGGEYNETDGGYLVRRSMAHLWVEVCFPGHGWVRFDPSPQSAMDRTPSIIEQMRMTASLYALKARMFWFRDVVGFQGIRSIDPYRLRMQIFGEIRSLQNSLRESAANGRLAQVVLGAGLGLGVLVLTLWMVYRGFRDYRFERPKAWQHYVLTRDQKRASIIYQKLRKKLSRCGIEISGKTAEELMEAVELLPWDDKVAALRLLHDYNEIRFGGRPLGGERLAAIRRALRGLRPHRA